MTDLTDLIRRLRRFGERWPHEEPTAALMGEAADELERLVAERDAFRKAYRVAVVCYLCHGHGVPKDKADVEAERRIREITDGLRTT